MRPGTRTVLAGMGVAAVAVGTVLVFAEQQHPFVSFAIAVIPVAWAALAGIVAWWLRGRRVAEPATAAQLTAAADWLAEATAVKWRREAAARRIITPAPASVRWRWAAGDLASPRRDVTAPPAPGTGPPPLPDLQQPGEILGSGVVTRVHDEVYARLPRGRLVMIGQPGSGKTGAMVLLLLAALERRAALADDARQRVPVPAWLTLGGWNPETQPLIDWVTDVLNRDYPSLRAREYGTDAARTLVRGGRVALFLDGLDEMAPDLRPLALQQLNTETAELRVVITSRPAEYHLAVEDATVDNVAVIELRPVRPDAAAAYLLRGQSGPGRARWQQFGNLLRDNPASVAAQALDNPLTLSLARDAYTARDPAVLADPARFPSTDSITAHLLDQFLITAYPDDRQRATAVSWLSWVAWHMGTDQDLQWWDIPNWVPPWTLRLVRGLLTGLTVAILASLMSWLSYQALVPGNLPRSPVLLLPGLPGLPIHGFVSPGFIARIAPGIGAGAGFALLAGVVARLAPRPAAARTPVPRDEKGRPDLLTRRPGCRSWVLTLSWMFLAALVTGGVVASPTAAGWAILTFVVFGLVSQLVPGPAVRPSFSERASVRATALGLAIAIGIIGWAWLYGLHAVLAVAVIIGIPTAAVCTYFFRANDLLGGRGFGLTGLPQVLTPRRPRWRRWTWRTAFSLPLLLLIGLIILPFTGPLLLSGWAAPATSLASATAASTYRTDRRTSVIYACGCALLPGIPLGLAIRAYFQLPVQVTTGSAVALLSLGWAITGAAATGLLAWQVAGRAPLMTLTHIVLRFRRGGSSVSLTRLLDDALGRQVLRQAGAVYQFRHATLQTHLAARYNHPPTGLNGH